MGNNINTGSKLKKLYSRVIMRLKYDPLNENFQSGRALFFVTGRSKSGTTWMGRLLNSHPSIFCDTTENSAFHQDFEYTYFGLPTASLGNYVGPYYALRTHTLLKNGLITNLIYKCDRPSVRIFGDKTPRQDVGRILDIFPKTKIIIMIRDFRDQIVSLAFHNFRQTGMWQKIFSSAEKKGLDNNFMEHHLRSFEKHNDFEKYKVLSTERPTQVILIRFEDLKSEPIGTFQKVLSFLDVDSSRSVAEKCVEMNTFEKLSGGRKAGKQNAVSFYRKGIIGDWQNHFTQENIDLFKKISGKTLIAAGYEQDNDWSLDSLESQKQHEKAHG
jgi:hypothetical protein